MADKFPNLPSIPVNIIDGNTQATLPPGGPIVAILGSAAKGPAKIEVRASDAPSAVTRFGSTGSLGRGLAEAFQGGAQRTIGYRLFTKPGRVEHIGDASGLAGITVAPVLEGASALSSYKILYDQLIDRLRVYEVATGILVFDKTGDIIAIDTGAVAVSGSVVNALGLIAFGSIGKKLPVKETEGVQTGTMQAGVLTFIAGAGSNLGKLGFITGKTPMVCQFLNILGTVLEEHVITAVDTATRLVTFDGASVSAIDGELITVRYVSLSQPIALDTIIEDRLFVTANGHPELLVTPGANFNGLPLLVNSVGLRVDEDLAEVEPHKMNLYEGLEDAALALEASELDYLVLMDAYVDDFALDGQASGDTALPAALFTEAAGAVKTIAGKADRLKITYANEAAADVGIALLAAEGRGASWITFTTSKAVEFGNNRETDEIVRTARILNWEQAAAVVTLHFNRDVGFSLAAVDGDVVVNQDPTFSVYSTDLLFFHRSNEVDGTLVHFWYTAKSDPEGNVFNEVNFAYKLAAVCNDLTENETTTLGVIGVRPPSNHFAPAAISSWIGKSPEYDEDGNVSLNGSGLLGNKFISGTSLNGSYAIADQFDPGFLATLSGELDDTEILLDANDFEIDLGKFLSIVATWPVMSNASDAVGLGYIASGAALYAGLISNLAPWRGSTAKPVGGRGVRLPIKLAKRHLNSLAGARYTLFNESRGAVTVVDGPTAALPTSDFTRNMTMRLVAEVVSRIRERGRPFLGDPLNSYSAAALETGLKKELNDVQRLSDGALQRYDLALAQSPLDKVRGTAKVNLTLVVVNELRKITVNVSLSL